MRAYLDLGRAKRGYSSEPLVPYRHSRTLLKFIFTTRTVWYHDSSSSESESFFFGQWPVGQVGQQVASRQECHKDREYSNEGVFTITINQRADNGKL